MIRPGSQNSRVLAALWPPGSDARTIGQIHQQAGTMRLNSRVSELRGHGCDIRHTSRRYRGHTVHSYQLLAAPAGWAPPAEVAEWDAAREQAQRNRDSAPRDAAHAYRIYGVRTGGVLDLLATASDYATLGATLVALGRAGKLKGVCVGVLETHGETEKGTWIVSPWEGR